MEVVKVCREILTANAVGARGFEKNCARTVEVGEAEGGLVDGVRRGRKIGRHEENEKSGRPGRLCGRLVFLVTGRRPSEAVAPFFVSRCSLYSRDSMHASMDQQVA